MAQTAGRGWQDLVMTAAGLYPAAIRSGVGYWSEMAVHASNHLVDVLEAAIRIAKQPSRSPEVLAELIERTRQYLASSGSTLERAILDFNQVLMTLARPVSEAPASVAPAPTAGRSDRVVSVFQQLADFAVTEAAKLQGAQGQPDLRELRERMESCLAELRRLESGPQRGTAHGGSVSL